MTELVDLAQLREASEQWTPERREAMLQYLKDEARRKQIKKRYRTAGELAQAVDPRYVVTPALDLIAESVETSLRRPRHNLLITTPPQEGKTTFCAVYTPLRALQLDPNWRIILATHGDALAEESSSLCRQIINQHGAGVVDQMTGVAVEDKLGYRIAPGSNKVKTWKVAGSRGGMTAVGWGSSITGRPADLFIIDDVFKNQMEADSINHRRKIIEWFKTVAMTRLSPQASVIHISTRWHPDDLAGWLLAGELAAEDPSFRTWRHINIPAIAQKNVPDALRRKPGEVMISARGRTRAEFDATRRTVGERVWWAMYQGSPQPPSGGLFQRDWFTTADEPEQPVQIIVAIDPADSGKDENDDTGILAGSLAPGGNVVITKDWSGKMTSDQWSRRAVMLALQIGASEIAMEAYATATTYVQVIKRAYRTIHQHALEKRHAGVPLLDVEERALTEQPPFTIHKWRGGAKIDAIGRSALLRQALENKRCRVVADELDTFVDQACGWQAGQHQPDRVAAAIILYDRLSRLSGGVSIASPVTDRPVSAPDWLRRSLSPGRRGI